MGTQLLNGKTQHRLNLYDSDKLCILINIISVKAFVFTEAGTL